MYLFSYLYRFTHKISLFDSESLGTSGRYRLQRSIDLRGRTSHDKVANGSLGDLEILIRAHDVDLSVGQDDPRLGGVLNRKLGPTVLSSHTTNSTRQMVTFQCLDICDLETARSYVVNKSLSFCSFIGGP